MLQKAFVCVEGTVFIKETLSETKDICLCRRHRERARACVGSVLCEDLYTRVHILGSMCMWMCLFKKKDVLLYWVVCACGYMIYIYLPKVYQHH